MHIFANTCVTFTWQLGFSNGQVWINYLFERERKQLIRKCIDHLEIAYWWAYIFVLFFFVYSFRFVYMPLMMFQTKQSYCILLFKLIIFKLILFFSEVSLLFFSFSLVKCSLTRSIFDSQNTQQHKKTTNNSLLKKTFIC